MAYGRFPVVPWSAVRMTRSATSLAGLSVLSQPGVPKQALSTLGRAAWRGRRAAPKTFRVSGPGPGNRARQPGGEAGGAGRRL